MAPSAGRHGEELEAHDVELGGLLEDEPEWWDGRFVSARADEP